MYPSSIARGRPRAMAEQGARKGREKRGSGAGRRCRHRTAASRARVVSLARATARAGNFQRSLGVPRIAPRTHRHEEQERRTEGGEGERVRERRRREEEKERDREGHRSLTRPPRTAHRPLPTSPRLPPRPRVLANLSRRPRDYLHDKFESDRGKGDETNGCTIIRAE